jgi:hypothetical protein
MAKTKAVLSSKPIEKAMKVGGGPNLSPANLELLAKLYAKQPLSLDRLPYTPQFDEIVDAFGRHRSGLKGTTHGDVWAALSNLRKSGRLPKRARSGA